MAKRRFRWDLAISFAGEQRDVAEDLARRLDAAGYSIFYDKFEDSWGVDLPVRFGEVYGKEARFCLIIVSEAYARKLWTNHERKFAVERALKVNSEYLLPLRIDDTELPGVPGTIGYIDVRTTSHDDVYKRLLGKLGPPQARPLVTLPVEDVTRARTLVQACFRRAVFTKLDSEIQLDAMFASLADALGRIQPLVPQFVTPELQRIGLEIIRALDGIERERGTLLPDPWRDRSARKRVEQLKLEIILRLCELRRRAALTIQLPTSLTTEHFFSAKDAELPPSPH